MKFIKQHKFTFFVIIIFIIAIIGLFFAYNLFFSNSGKPAYGNRLDNIEDVEIDEATINKISEENKKNDKVSDATVNVSGRTLEIILTVDDKMSLSDAKKIGNECYSTLSEKQIDYFSVQVFIKKKSEDQNNFPIIGYKQKKTKNIVWTKDRKVTSKDEKK